MRTALITIAASHVDIFARPLKLVMCLKAESIAS
jgi:hypothetical protein